MVISKWNAVRLGYVSQKALSQLGYTLKTELDSVMRPVCEYVRGREGGREGGMERGGESVCECVSQQLWV